MALTAIYSHAKHDQGQCSKSDQPRGGSSEIQRRRERESDSLRHEEARIVAVVAEDGQRPVLWIRVSVHSRILSSPGYECEMKPMLNWPIACPTGSPW